MSDAPLSTCPECGQATFSKQVTAAGFQLKGSGWYVTDFRGGNNAGANAGAGNGGNNTAAGSSNAAAAPAVAKPAPSSESSAS